MVAEVFDLGLDFGLEGLGQVRSQFAQGANDAGGGIAAHLLEQGVHPRLSFGRALSLEVMGHRPEVLVSVEQVQALLGLEKAVLDGIPNPGGAVGDRQDPLGGGHTALERFPIELAQQIGHAQPSGDITALADDGPSSGRLAAVV